MEHLSLLRRQSLDCAETWGLRRMEMKAGLNDPQDNHSKHLPTLNKSMCLCLGPKLIPLQALTSLCTNILLNKY